MVPGGKMTEVALWNMAHHMGAIVPPLHVGCSVSDSQSPRWTSLRIRSEPTYMYNICRSSINKTENRFSWATLIIILLIGIPVHTLLCWLHVSVYEITHWINCIYFFKPTWQGATSGSKEWRSIYCFTARQSLKLHFNRIITVICRFNTDK